MAEVVLAPEVVLSTRVSLLCGPSQPASTPASAPIPAQSSSVVECDAATSHGLAASGEAAAASAISLGGPCRDSDSDRPSEGKLGSLVGDGGTWAAAHEAAARAGCSASTLGFFFCFSLFFSFFRDAAGCS